MTFSPFRKALKCTIAVNVYCRLIDCCDWLVDWKWLDSGLHQNTWSENWPNSSSSEGMWKTELETPQTKTGKSLKTNMWCLYKDPREAEHAEAGNCG